MNLRLFLSLIALSGITPFQADDFQFHSQSNQDKTDSDHVFKTITIEHDFYLHGDLYRHNERALLTKLGYYLLCPDVLNSGYIYEDWWIHPDFFPSPLFSQLTALDLRAKDHEEIMQIVNAFIKER